MQFYPLFWLKLNFAPYFKTRIFTPRPYFIYFWILPLHHIWAILAYVAVVMWIKLYYMNIHLINYLY